MLSTGLHFASESTEHDQVHSYTEERSPQGAHHVKTRIEMPIPTKPRGCNGIMPPGIPE
jgi:hypothetical protein